MDPRGLIRFGVTLIFIAGVAAVARAELRVISDFENGSGHVIAIDAAAQHVTLTPSGDATRGWPNWWFVRIEGADPGRPSTVTVVARQESFRNEAGMMRIVSPRWTLPERAAVSFDGVAWQQTERTTLEKDRRTFTVPAGHASFWLAWGPPFSVSDAERWIESLTRTAPAKRFTLARSKEGREVSGIRVGAAESASQRPAVWLIARQHAWECGGSWVGVGFVEWLLGSDSDAAWLRQNAEVVFVPIVDVDCVARGDGGKEREPVDANRDWTERPNWPEVAALQEQLRGFARENRLAVFLDLHNPGDRNLQQSFYVDAAPQIGAPAIAAQTKFLDVVKERFGAVTLLDASPSKPEHLPLWRSFATSWVHENGDPETVALVVETPWNTAEGTVAGYKSVGTKLGQATAKYLREKPAPAAAQPATR